MLSHPVLLKFGSTVASSSAVNAYAQILPLSGSSMSDQFVRAVANPPLFGNITLTHRDDEVFLQMQQAVKRISEYTRVGREQFLNDLLLQDAVAYNFAVLGVWSKQLPEPLLRVHTELRALGSFRNQIVHHSASIPPELLWHNAEEVLDLDLQEIQDKPGHCAESPCFYLIFPEVKDSRSADELRGAMRRYSERLAVHLDPQKKVDFLSSQPLQDAAAYNLMIMGEVAYHLRFVEEDRILNALANLVTLRHRIAHPEECMPLSASWLWEQLTGRTGEAISRLRTYFILKGIGWTGGQMPAVAIR